MVRVDYEKIFIGALIVVGVLLIVTEGNILSPFLAIKCPEGWYAHDGMCIKQEAESQPILGYMMIITAVAWLYIKNKNNNGG